MQCRLGVGQASGGRLLVTTERIDASSVVGEGSFHVTPFQSENEFITRVLSAELAEDDTTTVITSILLTMSGRTSPVPWIPLSLSQRQLGILGLSVAAEQLPQVDAHSPLGLVSAGDFEDVLLQMPAPLAMLAGPEHVFTFVNQAYAKITGRTDPDSLLGKPVRKALPELEGQHFFSLLHQVYRTGKPYVGIEMLGNLYQEATATVKGTYFDFIYHPVRDSAGEVCGILCQSSDVTEHVIAKHVSEFREGKLYQQWAELEAVYRKSPLGMGLLDAKTFRILRMNEVKANWIGAPAEDLIGKDLFALMPHLTSLREVFLRVAAGETIRNLTVRADAPDASEKQKTWLLHFSPVLDPAGSVEAIASVSVDITDWSKDGPVIHLEAARPAASV